MWHQRWSAGFLEWRFGWISLCISRSSILTCFDARFASWRLQPLRVLIACKNCECNRRTKVHNFCSKLVIMKYEVRWSEMMGSQATYTQFVWQRHFHVFTAFICFPSSRGQFMHVPCTQNLQKHATNSILSLASPPWTSITRISNWSARKSGKFEQSVAWTNSCTRFVRPSESYAKPPASVRRKQPCGMRVGRNPKHKRQRLH